MQTGGLLPEPLSHARFLQTKQVSDRLHANIVKSLTCSRRQPPRAYQWDLREQTMFAAPVLDIEITAMQPREQANALATPTDDPARMAKPERIPEPPSNFGEPRLVTSPEVMHPRRIE